MRDYTAWGNRLRRPIFVVGSFVAFFLLVASVADVLSGNALLAVPPAATVALLGVVWLTSRHFDRQVQKTNEANGWNEPINPGKLAALGRRIPNPLLAERVREYIAWIDRLRKPAFVVGVIGTLLLLPALAPLLRGRYLRTVADSAAAAPWPALWIFWRHELRLHGRTLGANSWDLLGGPS